MGLVIVAVHDKRKRYRFLTAPLSEAEIDHDVIYDEKGFLSLLVRSLSYVLSHRLDKVVIIGGDFKNFIWYLLARMHSATVYMRLGGDPVSERKSLLQSLAGKRKFLTYLKYWINNQLTLFLIKHVDHFIVVNDEITTALKDYRSRAVFSTIPQYVDMPLIEPVIGQEGSDVVRLLTVTNLNYLEKAEGVCLLIQHLHEFCQLQLSSAKLVFQVVGGGRHEDLIKASVEEHNGLLDNLRVEFVGRSQQVPKYLLASDIFVYASELDATPNVLLEAKGYALPVITNSFAPFESLFLTDITRIFFSLSSSESFINVLTPLVRDPQLRKEIGRGNREEAERCFSLSAVTKKYNSLFL